MILSKTCDYAIRASLYVALQKDQKFVPIRIISQELNISFHFLTKILQILTQNNIMTSLKGPNGGVTLAKPADSISLKEIVLAVDGPDLFTKCLLGLEHCDDQHPCPIHDQWRTIRDQLEEIFEKNTIQDLAEKVKTNDFRISDLVVKSFSH